MHLATTISIITLIIRASIISADSTFQIFITDPNSSTLWISGRPAIVKWILTATTANTTITGTLPVQLVAGKSATDMGVITTLGSCMLNTNSLIVNVPLNLDLDNVYAVRIGEESYSELFTVQKSVIIGSNPEMTPNQATTTTTATATTITTTTTTTTTNTHKHTHKSKTVALTTTKKPPVPTIPVITIITLPPTTTILSTSIIRKSSTESPEIVISMIPFQPLAKSGMPTVASSNIPIEGPINSNSTISMGATKNASPGIVWRKSFIVFVALTLILYFNL